MLEQLIASFSVSPAAALGAVPSLPLAPPVRTMLSGALAAAVRVRLPGARRLPQLFCLWVMWLGLCSDLAVSRRAFDAVEEPQLICPACG